LILAAATFWLALTPRNLGIALILGYRKAISPLYGDVCRFHPTCSAYGLGQVQQRGLAVGSAMALWRILRCNPFSQGGLDNVRVRNTWFQINRFGFAEPKLVKGI
jgi:putative membrane protein insertion efficiency factor